MKDSLLMHRKQKTSYEGYSLEGRVEPESKKKVPSEAKASTDETSSADLEYLLEKILYSRNILPALERVEKNKGSHGVDGMQVDELRPFLKGEWPNIRSRILEGKYKPMPVRRVEIPKPDGGIRLLGIPTVLDRFLQQANHSRTLPSLGVDCKNLVLKGPKRCKNTCSGNSWNLQVRP